MSGAHQFARDVGPGTGRSLWRGVRSAGPERFRSRRRAWFATALIALPGVAGAAHGFVVTIGDVVPNYPASAPDPWTVGGDLVVGDTAAGTMHIGGAGFVFNIDGRVGRGAGGAGVVVVDGFLSSWESRGDLVLGDPATGGVGTVMTSDDAILYVGDIARVATFLGALTVSDFDAGGDSGGNLVVRNGSRLIHGGFASVGSGSGEYGWATVSGAGSTWTNSGDLRIGRGGSGVLTIEDGGSVSSLTGIVGDRSGSNGSVVVTGAGSIWTNESALFVGNMGEGVLTIAGGAGAIVGTGAAVAGTGVVEVTAGGLLSGDGTVNAPVHNTGGTVSPSLTRGELVVRSFVQHAGGTLAIEVGGSGFNGEDHDVLTVSGDAVPGGTLEVRVPDGPAPVPGERFTVLTADRVLGVFDAVDAAMFEGIYSFDVSYGAESVVLEVVARLLEGDGNNDGVVSAGDLLAAQQNFGGIGPAADGTDPGDANDDGVVSAGDLLTVQQNFGDVLSPAGARPGAGSTAIAEPAAAGLFGVVAAIVAMRRRSG